MYVKEKLFFSSSRINSAVIKKYNNSNRSWWRRCPHSVNISYFGNTTSDGNGKSMSSASNNNGVALAFRLG